MIHHYLTKYEECGEFFAEAWIQINFFKWSFCFWKKKMKIGNADPSANEPAKSELITIDCSKLREELRKATHDTFAKWKEIS